MFELLHRDADWLALPAAQWEDNEHYVAMAKIVTDLAVVNDTCERSVKDVQDYANAANDRVYRGNIIVVSNSHRIKLCYCWICQ